METNTSDRVSKKAKQVKTINQSLPRQTSSLRIFTTNVRGLLRNWNGIKQINPAKYEVLIFNEIWQIRDFENVNIEGFKIANIYQRTTQRGGGVVIYISDKLKTEKIESPIINGVIETTAIKINNNIIAGVYRPPSGNKNDFTDALTEWIATQNNRNIYISGDFNLNYKNSDKIFFETIEASTGLAASIMETTRVQSDTCIDNILTNIQGMHRVSTISIADHLGLLSALSLDVYKNNGSTFKYRVMKEANWLDFSEQLKSVRIRGQCINSKWSNLCLDIKSVIENSFPIKNSKREYKFTMSQGLLKSKNKKKNYYANTKEA